MKKLFLILFLAVISVSEITSQNEYIDYRSTTNPLYWKNRKPFADYWQQDVHYTIKATLNDTTDIISGHEELTYWNNSPKSRNNKFAAMVHANDRNNIDCTDRKHALGRSIW